MQHFKRLSIWAGFFCRFSNWFSLLRGSLSFVGCIVLSISFHRKSIPSLPFLGFHRAKQSKLVMCCIWILSYRETALIEMYILISERVNISESDSIQSIYGSPIQFFMHLFAFCYSLHSRSLASSACRFFLWTVLSCSLSIVFRNETCVIDRCWRWVIYRQQHTQSDHSEWSALQTALDKMIIYLNRFALFVTKHQIDFHIKLCCGRDDHTGGGSVCIAIESGPICKSNSRKKRFSAFISNAPKSVMIRFIFFLFFFPPLNFVRRMLMVIAVEHL